MIKDFHMPVIICLSVFVYLTTIILFENNLFNHKVIKSYIYDVIIECESEKYILKGFLDTGNNSCIDSPIIFVDEKIISPKNCLKYNINTISGIEKINVFRPKNFYIKIGGKFIKKNVMIGLSNNLLDYQVLLNINIFKGE